VASLLKKFITVNYNVREKFYKTTFLALCLKKKSYYIKGAIKGVNIKL